MLGERNLAIIKAALEGDIIRQKESPNKENKEFKRWLNDSEKLLKKVREELFALQAAKFKGRDHIR